MIHALDHVVIAVSDLERARDSYTKILGRRASWNGEHAALGTRNALFRLANTYLELLTPVGEGLVADQLREHIDRLGEGLFALAFATDDAKKCAKSLRERGIEASNPAPGKGRDLVSCAERLWRSVTLSRADTRGVWLFAIEHLSPAETLPPAEPIATALSAAVGLDHVVVRSNDAEATRSLYGDKLGFRLALDRCFAERRIRLLFFRVGGVTIEIGSQLGAAPEPTAADQLWGLAYRVPDVPAARARMAEAGVDVSGIRVGRKPGTCVATVREPTHGVATLIVGPE